MVEEFEILVGGDHIGWWRRQDEPFTFRPQPTPQHPDPPTFRSDYRPLTLYYTPIHLTWNGTYLQFTHRQLGQRTHIPTTYFHRQLAMDHARETHQPIPPNAQVHHINETKHDNRLENLQLVTPQQHQQLHRHQHHQPAAKAKAKAKAKANANPNRNPLRRRVRRGF